MRWSKIKNIILVLLVVVNLALLSLVGIRTLSSEHNERELREGMVALLEKNGIGYLPASLPGDMTLTPCKVTVVSPGMAEAEQLLGTISTSTVQGARVTYVGERGTAEFSESGDIRVTFPTTQTSTRSGETVQTTYDPEESRVIEYFSDMGTPLQKIRSYSATGASSLYVQLWNGQCVYGRTAEVTHTDAGWVVTLRRVAGTEEPVAAPGTPLTAATALARFLEALKVGGYICNQITDLSPGYLASGVSSVTLAPAWFIETDAWPWRFAVDAYTGEVSTVT